MKVVIQRVSEASVIIENEIYQSIGLGYLLLLGYADTDEKLDVEWVTQKILNLRLFSDKNNLMNLSLDEVNGEILCISQFTLHAKTKKGNRPSFIKAAKPEIAIPLYNYTIELFKNQIPDRVKTGQFGADMKIQLINNGPVTIIIDSKNKI